MKTHLEKAVWSWMLNDLSVPRKEFNNHAICPWIRTYKNKIYVREVDEGVKIPIEHAISLLKPLGFVAIVLAFPKKPPIGTINKIVTEIINLPENDDIEILINDHRRKGKVRGVYTGFNKCDLVIVQNKNTLKYARIHSKKSGYYKTD